MKLKLSSLTAALWFTVTMPAEAVSPAQMEMFKQLPASQQQALAAQYGVSIDDLMGATPASGQVVKQQLPQKRELKKDKQAPLLAFENEPQITRFGVDVFATLPNGFEPQNNTPVPSSYLLGSGDSLNIQLYGAENSNFELFIDNQGDASFPKIGPVQLAGLTFKQAKDKIQTIVASQKIGVKSNVSMGKLRKIEIFVVGDSYQPGKYLVSAHSTMTHAIYSSGGVTEVGSLRDIRLLRNGKMVSKLDLYDLLINGSTSADAQLQNGDVVFIAPVNKTATVTGEVKRPAIYELAGNETLDDLVALAGGFTNNAFVSSVKMLRNNQQGFIETLTLNYHKQKDSVKTQDGDVLEVGKIDKHINNVVSLKGDVARPGDYQYKPGMTVADLFEDGIHSINKSSDLNYALLVRKVGHDKVETLSIDLDAVIAGKTQANIALQQQDELLVFSRYDFTPFLNEEQQSTEILSVEQAQQQAETEQQQQQDLENNQQFELAEKAPTEGQQPLSKQQQQLEKLKQKLNVEQAMEALGLDESALLRAWQATRSNLLKVVTLQLEEQASIDQRPQFASVIGEVRFPGKYPLTKGADLLTLIKSAGGLTGAAYQIRSELTRKTIKPGRALTQVVDINLADILSGKQSYTLQPEDKLHIVKVPDIESERTVSLQGEVKFPGIYTLQRGETLGQLLARAGGLTEIAHVDGAVFTRESLRIKEQEQLNAYAESIRQQVAQKSLRQAGPGSMTDRSSPREQLEMVESMSNSEALGRMVVDLPAITQGQVSRDFLLENGDLLYVPQFRNTITILGEVQVTTSYLLDPELNYEDYIDLAGGMKKQADEDRVFIVRANGAVVKPESGFWFGNDDSPLMPGDTIVVPVDSDYRDSLTATTMMTQILYQIGVAVNAIK
ncbi:SLBB domain-containing protein [Paraferrimonas sp. SM1919]|uniref:SLBB domain-containing protein n=1 Tax=Paraferrimonas sp. SM1919 TaxID=2662263 RepID=UPI0013D015D9|nr:SLBB domain-containing protein [Paraferrimonas sp. SM1919]